MIVTSQEQHHQALLDNKALCMQKPDGSLSFFSFSTKEEIAFHAPELVGTQSGATSEPINKIYP